MSASQPHVPPGQVPVEAGQDINVSLIATVGIFAAVGLFVLIVGLQAWFYTYSAAEKALKTLPDTTYDSMVHLQKQQLAGEGEWQGKVLPIDQAMDRVQREYAVINAKP